MVTDPCSHSPMHLPFHVQALLLTRPCLPACACMLNLCVPAISAPGDGHVSSLHPSQQVLRLLPQIFTNHSDCFQRVTEQEPLVRLKSSAPTRVTLSSSLDTNCLCYLNTPMHDRCQTQCHNAGPVHDNFVRPAHLFSHYQLLPCLDCTTLVASQSKFVSAAPKTHSLLALSSSNGWSRYLSVSTFCSGSETDRSPYSDHRALVSVHGFSIRCSRNPYVSL